MDRKRWEQAERAPTSALVRPPLAERPRVILSQYLSARKAKIRSNTIQTTVREPSSTVTTSGVQTVTMMRSHT